MALQFDQLVSPLNQASWLQLLLSALQGVGPVVQAPANGTNQLIGTGTFSVAGPTQASAQVVIQITTTGNAASSSPAFFQYSLDGGLSFFPSTPVSMASLAAAGFSYVIPTVSISITFENGAYTTAGSGGYSFVEGETYSFQCNTPTFPVTNWPAIGVGNALTQIDAQALSDLNLLTAQAIAGGLTQSWINPPLVNGVPTPPPDGWLDLLSQSFYNRQRGGNLQTQGIGVLTAVSTGGPYTILPGQLFAATANGQFIFTNTSGGTIAKGGSLPVTWQALSPGSAYNQVLSYGVGASGFWLTQMLTPLAGVSLTNPLQSTPNVSQSGPGSGVVTAQANSGGPSGEYQVLVKILQAGGLGTGTFQYSTNGGTTYSAQFTIPSGPGTFLIGATNVVVTFSGTFSAGAIYAFSTAWITQYGVDEQSSLSLAVSCQNQWATLSPASPSGQYVLWAQAASPEVVTALVIPDPVIPGQVDLTLIGASNGPVSAAAITAVSNYIAPRAPLGITVVVGTVATLTVATQAAYIVVHSAYRNTVQNAIQSLLNTYALTIFPQGTVELSVVAELIQQAPGVVEINPLSSLQLNPGGAGWQSSDVPLTVNQTAKITAPASSSFKFV